MSDIPSPISATEKYLSKMAGSYSGDLPSPVSRDEIFMYYAAINSGGGGEGTTDYTQLENKPSINGVTLTGNKTTADLNLSTDLSNYYTKPQADAKITEKVAEIVADAPEDFDTLKEMSDWIDSHEDSAAAMNSAIQANTTAIAGKVDKVTGKGLSTEDYTPAEKAKLAGLSNYDDTALQTAVSNKVDKVSGKGLSTEDYTTAEKTKLAGLSNYDDTALTSRVSALETTVGDINTILEEVL